MLRYAPSLTALASSFSQPKYRPTRSAPFPFPTCALGMCNQFHEYPLLIHCTLYVRSILNSLWHSINTIAVKLVLGVVKGYCTVKRTKIPFALLPLALLRCNTRICFIYSEEPETLTPSSPRSTIAQLKICSLCAWTLTCSEKRSKKQIFLQISHNPHWGHVGSLLSHLYKNRSSVMNKFLSTRYCWPSSGRQQAFA